MLSLQLTSYFDEARMASARRMWFLSHPNATVAPIKSVGVMADGRQNTDFTATSTDQLLQCIVSSLVSAYCIHAESHATCLRSLPPVQASLVGKSPSELEQMPSLNSPSSKGHNQRQWIPRVLYGNIINEFVSVQAAKVGSLSVRERHLIGHGLGRYLVIDPLKAQLLK
ncbi:hypothetical protein BCR43DRAFT_562917 [Syncephalastrum racemosum]|uniref:Uncharacterized protein n=1 Tax=Syncephalastrum racemosum TaxID=13706 RepID=A0A1X2HEX7_SYNRA|nr:hypothetical protein BCR43DRAFT_562917 [Syncephalastrum racemosum]